MLRRERLYFPVALPYRRQGPAVLRVQGRHIGIALVQGSQGLAVGRAHPGQFQAPRHQFPGKLHHDLARGIVCTDRFLAFRPGGVIGCPLRRRTARGVTHLVAQLRAHPRSQFFRVHVQRQRLAQALHDRRRISQQLIVTDLQGVGGQRGHQRSAVGAAQAQAVAQGKGIAFQQGAGHLQRRPVDHAYLNSQAHIAAHGQPERQRQAEARVLGCAHRAIAEARTQQLRRSLSGGVKPVVIPVDDTGGRRVPGGTAERQQLLVQGDHFRVFPEPLVIHTGDGPEQAVPERHATGGQGGTQRGGARAVHTCHDQEGLTTGNAHCLASIEWKRNSITPRLACARRL